MDDGYGVGAAGLPSSCDEVRPLADDSAEGSNAGGDGFYSYLNAPEFRILPLTILNANIPKTYVWQSEACKTDSDKDIELQLCRLLW